MIKQFQIASELANQPKRTLEKLQFRGGWLLIITGRDYFSLFPVH